ncbi:MAG TPA: hypothetical protein VHB73_06155 [Alphaproteobacteria bacterium]|nr:hypothetical protein [Alphaproteobacteria bacterium]
MKKALLILCAFLMLTPGLACAMPMCQPSASHAPSVTEHCDHNHAGGQHSHGPMLNGECAKVDLQVSTDHPTVKAPSFSSIVFYDTALNDGLEQGFRLARFKAIRGPPPDWPGLATLSQNTFRATARIRI